MTWSEHQYDPATIKDSWGTPDNVLDAIHQHFGVIGLDPCANKQRPLRVNHQYGPGHARQDGLNFPWDGHGLVYVNPPYFDLAPWAHKAATEGDEVIMLLPARTGAKWFQKYCAPADVVLFWQGRLKFHGAKDIAPFASILIYWGPRPDLFLTAFPGHWFITNKESP